MTPGGACGIAVADRQHHMEERRVAEVACGGAVAGSWEVNDGYGEVYRALERLCPIGAESGAAQRPSAPDPGASGEGAAGGQGRAVRQSDPGRRRRPEDRAGADRGRTQQIAKGRG